MVNAKDQISENNIEKQYVATVDLPFVLRLPDAIYPCKYGKQKFSIKTSWIEEKLGDKQDFEQQPADVREKGKWGGYLFQPKTGKLTSASGVHIPGAMLRYTVVKVFFVKRFAETEITNDYSLLIRDCVHKFINHFLDNYRFIADDDAVRPLSRSELHQVRAGQAFHLVSNYVIGGHGKMEMGIMFDENDPASVGGPQTISEDKVALFKEKLLASQIVLMENLLLLNARGYMRSGETKFAVIDMNTALDVVVERIAIYILIKQGKNPDEAKKILEQKSTSEIIKKIILPLIPREDRPKKDWNDWLKIYRELRNKVVHDGYTPTEKEAKDSLVNLQKLCAYFRSLQPSSS